MTTDSTTPAPGSNAPAPGINAPGNSAPGNSPPAAGSGFVHLHLHTEYSLLDGGNRIERLMRRVKDLGMEAVAMTDHGNLYGAVEFYTRAREAGIKPILGLEAYVATGARTERKAPTSGGTSGGQRGSSHHLVLLAETQTGWENLLRLSTDAFLEGFYYKPRMDKSTLEQWSEGLIAINGHLGSSLAHHVEQFVQSGNEAHWAAAIEEARWHKDTFGTNEWGDPCAYVEIQRHSVEAQQRINGDLIRLAREVGMPVICDNDAHYLTVDDYDTHNVLCCISMQKTKDDPSRIIYSPDLYVKSPEQMRELFADIPEAVDNTVHVAQRCNVELDFDANHAPVVQIASEWGELPTDPRQARELAQQFTCEHATGSTEWYKAFCARFTLAPYDKQLSTESPDVVKEQCDAALRMLAEAGAIWRYGADGVDDEKRQRLDRELKILADKLISAYFLIVWDFVSWSRQHNISAGARGSGIGTIVGYVLGLSNACPVRYGLLFERFTDPDRTEYPDIDIDICQDGRADVINYVREKYGYVAQIITFGRLKARQAIKDVARVNGLSAGDGQRLANLVPSELNITIDAALQKDPDFRNTYENEPAAREVIDTAKELEGHARHAGVHAAGVVIATQPLETIVPLSKLAAHDDVVTQWDGPTCERVGLLKMDFLGLRTLSTIERACTLIRETLPDAAVWKAVGRSTNDGGPHPLDLDRLELTDQTVLDLFRRGDTAGIFQFESGGMRKLLLDMRPDRLEDLIAANALFRPGPMDLIPEYCLRKQGKQPVPQVHAIVDGYTEETYGIMVYQEQVMQIVHSLGGIPLRQAYTLIKAISKKKKKVIDANRPKFITGAVEKGLTRQKAEELFDLILKFAGYGFNKSHSTGYAIIAYQTAYLKTYFPVQYMAALLTYESGANKIEDWSPYLNDCRQTQYPDHTSERPHLGVDVHPPDLNSSQAAFAVVFDPDDPLDNLHGYIRFGIGAIKGVGRSAIAGIIKERDKHGPFRSIFDFCERVPPGVANKATVEALIKSGAFDSVHERDQRAGLTVVIDDAMAAGHQLAEDRKAGQMSIFGAIEEELPDHERVEPPVPDVPPWSQKQTLDHEKAVLGMYVSGSPLERYATQLREYSTISIAAMEDAPGDAPVVLGGLLTSVRVRVVKSGARAGEKMAMITVGDDMNTVDGVVFTDAYQRSAELLVDDAVVFLIGRVDHSRGATQIIVDRVLRMEDAPLQLAQQIELSFDGSADGDAEQQRRMTEAASLLEAAQGPPDSHRADVFLHVHSQGRRAVLRSQRFHAVPTPMLVEQLEGVVGAPNVRVVGGHVPKIDSGRRGRGNNRS